MLEPIKDIWDVISDALLEYDPEYDDEPTYPTQEDEEDIRDDYDEDE